METINLAWQRRDSQFEIIGTPHVVDDARLMKLLELGGNWLISYHTDEIDPRVGHENDHVIGAWVANNRRDVTPLVKGAGDPARFDSIVKNIPSRTLEKIADGYQLSDEDKQNIINAIKI